jgi:hypothetical protein
MIEKRIKILSEYLSNQKNVTWRESKAFDEIIEHCLYLDKHYKDKTLYLERFASWFVDHMFENNQDHIDEVSYEFLNNIILRKLVLILQLPAELNYSSIENNIMALDMRNNNKLKEQGSIPEAIKLFIRDCIAYNTKDIYETTQN